MLLQKAKVITTPTAYSDGILHSVKPNVLENLITYSNDFTQWNPQNVNITTNAVQNPFNTGTTQTITEKVNTSTQYRVYTSSYITSSGIVYAHSVYVKRLSGTRDFAIIDVNGGARVYFDMTNILVGAEVVGKGKIEDVGNGWYRLSVYGVATGNSAFYLALTNGTSGGSETYTSDGSGSYAIYGAQLNKGYSADQYIETTTEASPRADFTFTRNSSATRVGEDGYIQDVQIIGGELTQNGNFDQISSELVTNGDFSDGDTGWSILDASAVFENDEVTLLGKVGNSRIRQSTPLASGKIYKFVYEITNIVGTPELRIYNAQYLVAPMEEGYNTFYVKMDTDTYVYFNNNNGGLGNDITIDNVSVKEVGQNWTFGTGWSMGDGVVVGTSVSKQFMQQPFTFVSGKKYRTTCTVTGTDTLTNDLCFRLPYDGKTVNIAYATKGQDGVYTHEFVSTGGSYIYFGYIDTGTFTGTVDNISIKEVTDDTNLPRINYEGFSYENGLPIYGSGKGHFLLEGQSTNLVPYSEDFEAISWIEQSCTITSNNAISPDGTQNATLIESTFTASSYIADPTASVTIGNTYTFSVFAKKGNNNWIRIAHISSAATAAWFDLENGVVGTVNSISATIEDYGNGWYRCSNTFVATNSSGNLTFVGICDDDNSTNSGAIGQNDYIWGWQLEENNATSYIPTNGSAVTRAAETCNNAGNADLFDSEGVLYAEIASENDGTYRRIALSDGTADNRIFIGYTPSSNQLRFYISSNAINVVSIYYILSDVTDFNKIAVRYKENDFSLWVNGVQVATDTSGAEPIGLNELAFDDGNGAVPFKGKTKMVGVFPYLSNDEMECLTGEGYGSFEAMALANNYTVI